MRNRELNETSTNKNRSRIKNVGLFLVALSFLLYASLLLVPFTPFTIGTKAAITSALVITGELSFWAGGIILGREFVSRYRDKLNPLRWLKKKGQ